VEIGEAGVAAEEMRRIETFQLFEHADIGRTQGRDERPETEMDGFPAHHAARSINSSRASSARVRPTVSLESAPEGSSTESAAARVRSAPRAGPAARRAKVQAAKSAK
jgi:hypothetical protein